MDRVNNVRIISIFIFLLPFSAINICLILGQIFPYGEVFAIGDAISEDWRPWLVPYFDGSVSISRVARVFPSNLIFKPAMLITSFLLVNYWLNNKKIIIETNKNQKYIKIIMFFGVGSAVALALHSVFLGIKFDYDLYKLFRRVVLLSFIIFEIIAQAYLVIILYSLKIKLVNYINPTILKLKMVLVCILVVVAIIAIPYLNNDENKILKHALEWNYFVGIICFYILTSLMWKKQKNLTNNL
jgi:hypothetical protein